jgi:hypothetical protein
MDMHVTMPWYMTVKEQRKEVCAIIALIKEKFGEAAELSVTSDPCRSLSCASCRCACNERKQDFIKVVEWNISNLSGDVQHEERCGNGNE